MKDWLSRKSMLYTRPTQEAPIGSRSNQSTSPLSVGSRGDNDRYADQMGENLDLLVLGGWWGKGGRTGKISSLLLGLRKPQDDDGSGETPE